MGVFTGVAGADYGAIAGLLADGGEGYLMTGNAINVVSGRVAYSLGLMAMLSLSAAYHFHHASARGELLRRLDHAAIFVMIAGTYTPFTVGILNGAAALWSTGSMWAAALAGAAVKWAYPRRFEWVSIVCYLAMGWAAVIFMRPLLAARAVNIL